VAPNRDAPDKIVALTFEIVNIDDNVKPNGPGPLVLSTRDELTSLPADTVREIVDRFEAALRLRGIEADLRRGNTPDDQVPG
jgi:hypothetical protein